MPEKDPATKYEALKVMTQETGSPQTKRFAAPRVAVIDNYHLEDADLFLNLWESYGFEVQRYAAHPIRQGIARLIPHTERQTVAIIDPDTGQRVNNLMNPNIVLFHLGWPYQEELEIFRALTAHPQLQDAGLLVVTSAPKEERKRLKDFITEDGKESEIFSSPVEPVNIFQSAWQWFFQKQNKKSTITTPIIGKSELAA